jgi:2-iminoacetate synthase
MTQQRFGKVIRLFAPLYLSNECINNCSYCGFSRDNPILRVTLSLDEVRQEAQALKAQGFRNILLVAGEHPKFVSNNYLRDCIAALHADWPSISLEVGPMETEDYRPLVAAGADGLVVYQETYDRKVYADMHTAGPKRNFDWRLETPERAYAAGFRRLGISPLYGLADWRYEAIERGGARGLSAAQLLEGGADDFHGAAASVRGRVPAAHAHHRPRTGATRLRAAPDVPDVGIVLSTRESAKLRDGLMPLGVTMMSAGSHTEPGGYTGAGKEKIHHTVRGIIVELASGASEWAPQPNRDERDRPVQHRRRTFAGEVAELIRKLGYEPVWKDWDAALTA